MYLGKLAPFNVSGFFAMSADTYGCALVTDGSIFEKIIVVFTGNCDDAQKARNIQSAGGLGMVSLDYAQNSLKTPSKFYGAQDIVIPCVSVYIASGEISGVILDVYSCGGNCTGYISSDDYAISITGYWMFISLFFIGGYVINIMYSIMKLLQMRNANMISRFGLPHLVLYTSILISIINIFANIDPSSAGRGIWSNNVYASLLTLSWPFTMGNSLAMSFHWQEFTSRVMESQQKRTVFSLEHRPMIIFFWVVFVFLFLINLMITSLRATYLTNFSLVLIFNTVIYMTCVLCVSIFFIVSSTKLYRLLRNSIGHVSNNTSADKKKGTLMRINTIRILCGIFWVGFLFSCVAITVTAVSASPGSYFASFFVWQFFLYCVDTCHIQFFNTAVYAQSPTVTYNASEIKHSQASSTDITRSSSNADTTKQDKEETKTSNEAEIPLQDKHDSAISLDGMESVGDKTPINDEIPIVFSKDCIV